MDRPLGSYEVGIVYCNGAQLNHDHDDVTSAIKEYAGLLGEAVLSPTVRYAPPRRHVRQATLTLLSGGQYKTIDTGVFDCEHTQEGSSSGNQGTPEA